MTSSVLLFAVICWRTRTFEIERIAGFVTAESRVISRASPSEALWTVRSHLANAYHEVTFAALFGPDGQLIAGNIRHVPAALPAEGDVHEVETGQFDQRQDGGTVIAVATRLPDGGLLVLGRGIGVGTSLENIVAGALLLGLGRRSVRRCGPDFG